MKRKINKYTGIYFVESRMKYLAQVKHNKKTKHIGFFSDIEIARSARNQYIIDNDLQDTHSLS